MNRHERLSALLELVLKSEHVHIDEIVRDLGVSPATARRDLDELAQQQLITRTRGGASPHTASSDLPLRYKTTRQAEQKQRIAKAATALVTPGDIVALNGGTTTTEVAREIAIAPALQEVADGEHVVVVTNAVNIANELTVRPHLRVVVTGGVARALSYELTGPLSTLLLAKISVNTLFLGVDALSATVGASAHNEDEAATNAALVKHAARVVVVADSTKFTRTAFARICPAQDINLLITDSGADPAVVRDFEEAGIEVLLV